MKRKGFALANWKMAMTIPQSRAFVQEFLARAGDLLDRVDVVLCPPYTALAAVADMLRGMPVGVGGQDLWPGPGEAHTGAISAELLADAGATWVMVGHWEVRRRLREEDPDVNRKIRAALAGGLRPILLVGEPAGGSFDPDRLGILLAGCAATDVERMAFVYEPEGAIGQAAPVTPEQAAAGCRAIRCWLAVHYGLEIAEGVRIIYGGSVTPEHAAALLSDPDVDGLGATRRGRDPAVFAEIVAAIAQRGKG
ncbi:MAG: triose-phosphate isomerase family protein [Anaerolineae bacterium]|nr:triose-phosphate isomerase [Anaerolineae bacterium]MDW7990670.1 triose-phosphate isomerase family protein [Anaerolineae bacterium]